MSLVSQRILILTLANPGAWPRAALLSPSAATVELPRRGACSHDRALCRDYTLIAGLRLPGSVEMTGEDGSYTFRVDPVREDRLLFL